MGQTAVIPCIFIFNYLMFLYGTKHKSRIRGSIFYTVHVRNFQFGTPLKDEKEVKYPSGNHQDRGNLDMAQFLTLYTGNIICQTLSTLYLYHMVQFIIILKGHI